MGRVDNMLLYLLPLIISWHAAAAPHPPPQKAPIVASEFQQYSSHPRDVVASAAVPARFFTLNETDKFAAALGIELYGLAKIIMNDNRPVDTFILNGNTLLAENRNGSCYVNPDDGHLGCEDIPDGVPRQNKDFQLAPNGTLVFSGTSNWWACPAQNPGTFDIYYSARRISPYCKITQLQSASLKTKRSLHTHQAVVILAEKADVISSRATAAKTCAFHVHIEDSDIFAKENEKLKKTTYFWVGKRLGSGPSGFHYCYINGKTRKLDCADKTNKDMLENFHNIDFAVSSKGYLMHNGTEKWTMCKTNKGWEGPYDDLKVADATCQATQVQLMVQTIAGHECGPIAKLGSTAPAVLVSRSKTVYDSTFNRCTFKWGKTIVAEAVGYGYEPSEGPGIRFSLDDGRLTATDAGGICHRCEFGASDFSFGCEVPIGAEASSQFSIDPVTQYLVHGPKVEPWYACGSEGSFPVIANKLPSDANFCLRVYVKAEEISCAGNKAMPSSKLDLRSLETPPTPPSPKCPSSLEDTLFKSPILVVPISSENKTQAQGNVDSITVTPSQNTTFNFVIPYTKPYFNKTCALLLMLPEIDHLEVDYQTTPPGLKFSILEKPVDEQTTWNTAPASHPLISKAMLNEIKPGRNNLISTFPCDSGTVKSFMMSSRGGLSITVRQEGVPNESGLHLVPCA